MGKMEIKVGDLVGRSVDGERDGALRGLVVDAFPMDPGDPALCRVRWLSGHLKGVMKVHIEGGLFLLSGKGLESR